MIPVDVDSSIDQVEKEVFKIQDEELHVLWKERLLQKLEKVKKKIKKMKTVPVIQEPEVHPLKNSVVLKEVFDYIQSPSSTDSYDTLKTLRFVCREWRDLITPTFMMKSNIRLYTSLRDCIEKFGTDSYVLTAIKNSKTSLIINHPQLLEIKQLSNWLKLHGQNLIGLSIGHEKEQFYERRTLYPILQNTNLELEHLNLFNVALKLDETDDADPSDLNESLESTPKFNIKHLKIFVSAKIGNRFSAVIEILLRLEHLESLSLFFQYLYRRDWDAFFSTVASKNKGIFKHLSRLELLEFKSDAWTLKTISELELPNLKHLRLDIDGKSPFVSFLELVGQNLETLDIMVRGNARSINMAVIMPTMSNLVVFEYSYSNSYDCNDSDHQIKLVPTFSSRKIISSLPTLKHWKVVQRKFEAEYVPAPDRWGSKLEASKFFSLWTCEEAKCAHAQQLLEAENDTNEDEIEMPFRQFHECLETLDFSCSVREPELISRMASLFGNIKELSIWVHSALLNEFFFNLIPLEKLKVLKIGLACNVEDFAITINSNLPKFKTLKELTFEKCSRLRPKSSGGLADYYIFHVDEARTGFSLCDSLDILSFKNMKIDAAELDKLRVELRKSKPNLALIVSSL